MQPLFVEVANSDSEPKILNTPPIQAIADPHLASPALSRDRHRPGPHTSPPVGPRNHPAWPSHDQLESTRAVWLTVAGCICYRYLTGRKRSVPAVEYRV